MRHKCFFNELYSTAQNQTYFNSFCKTKMADRKKTLLSGATWFKLQHSNVELWTCWGVDNTQSMLCASVHQNSRCMAGCVYRKRSRYVQSMFLCAIFPLLPLCTTSKVNCICELTYIYIAFGSFSPKLNEIRYIQKCWKLKLYVVNKFIR